MWSGSGTDSDAVSAELGLMLTSVTASKCSLTYLNLRNPLPSAPDHRIDGDKTSPRTKPLSRPWLLVPLRAARPATRIRCLTLSTDSSRTDPLCGWASRHVSRTETPQAVHNDLGSRRTTEGAA